MQDGMSVQAIKTFNDKYSFAIKGVKHNIVLTSSDYANIVSYDLPINDRMPSLVIHVQDARPDGKTKVKHAWGVAYCKKKSECFTVGTWSIPALWHSVKGD